MQFLYIIIIVIFPLSITPSNSTTELSEYTTTEGTTTKTSKTTTTAIQKLEACTCNITEYVGKAEQNIREEVKQTQTRLVDPVRTAIGYAMSEKQHLLSLARYATYRDILKNYPELIFNSEFELNYDSFHTIVTKLLVDDTRYSSAGIKHELSMAMSDLMKKTLQQGFLCLAIGKCRTVPLDYSSCMERITNWEIYLSDSSRKAANHLADSIYRYRKMESIIIEIHQQLMNASNLTISETCLSKYVELTICNCTTSCSSVCNGSLDVCFGEYTSQWAAKLLVLKTMSNGPGISNSFMRMRKSIIDSLRVLVERKSPLYAEHITAQCGPIGDLFIHPKKHNFVLTKPTTKYTAQAEKAAKELQLSVKTWERLSRQVCNTKSVFGSVGNTNPICRTAKKVTVLKIEDQLPPIMKDVRPRPMLEAIEKARLKKQDVVKSTVEFSGRIPNWDDEEGDDDFNGNSSGSGAPLQIIDNSPSSHPKSIFNHDVVINEEIVESLATSKHLPIFVTMLILLLR